MCNISGYIGTRPAAPILIDMMRRQEGFDSGFYTGIATIHEGKIHYAKVVGDLDTLLNETNAAELPGTIGFLHGRTPGAKDQGVEWGHPFTTIKDGEPVSALIANGCMRFFEPRLPQRNEVARRVHEAGYPFKSSLYKPDATFKLPDDTTMHYTDVLCQLVTMKVDQGMDTISAMGEALCEFTGENVSLYMTNTRPDGISFARVNFPMHLNFVEHGAYLATSPMAFPEDAGEPFLLPAMSSGFITRDSLSVKPFPNPPATVAPLDSVTYKKVYDVVYAALHREGGLNMYNVDVKPCFEPADIIPSGAAVYRALYDINRREPITIHKSTKPGQKEGQTAPQFNLSL